MSNKTDAAIIWLTISIFIVTGAFAVTWYNQSQTIALKNRQLTRSLNLEADMRNTIHELNVANDSLFKVNDSLILAMKQMTLVDSSTVGYISDGLRHWSDGMAHRFDSVKIKSH
jgi:hypothetical protein